MIGRRTTHNLEDQKCFDQQPSDRLLSLIRTPERWKFTTKAPTSIILKERFIMIECSVNWIVYLKCLHMVAAAQQQLHRVELFTVLIHREDIIHSASSCTTGTYTIPRCWSTTASRAISFGSNLRFSTLVWNFLPSPPCTNT